MNQRLGSTPAAAIGVIDAELGPRVCDSSTSRLSATRVEIAASYGSPGVNARPDADSNAGASEGPIDEYPDEDPNDGIEALPRWSKVLDLLLDELITGAGEAEAQPFLHRVGMRLAADLPLGQPETLSALTSAINRRLSQLDWGWCSIRDAGRHLVIEQGDYPLMDARHASAAGHPRLIALSWMLCGLYQGWLGAQGGRASISCERCHAHQSLIFHYGGA